MRISDWSSDVCSSDLDLRASGSQARAPQPAAHAPAAGGDERVGPDGQPGGARLGRDRTAADVAGPVDVVDARAPHRLRAPAGRRPQGRPDAVRARRRGRGGVALDRQRQRGLERGVDAGAGLPRRLVGAGRRVRLPAGDPGPQRTQEEGVVSEAGRHVLLADIGGTNARFALADTAAQLPLLEDSVKEYAVADFPSLGRSEEHTSELQSLMRISYAVFCLKKKKDT